MDHFDEFVSMDVEAFSKIDLGGRPMLSEQGRVVTRALVARFRYDAHNWYLDLKQVDYLDKETGQWTRRYETDEYTSEIDGFEINYYDAAHEDVAYLKIGGYGMSVFLGIKSDAPWTTMKWPNILQTDAFEGGILGENSLP